MIPHFNKIMNNESMNSKQRSTSFEAPAHIFQKLSKKSHTMITPPSYVPLSSLSKSFKPLNINDVMYRKFFSSANNHKFPVLKKNMSLTGLEGSWVNNLTSSLPPVPPPSSPTASKSAAVIVVDCFSTGAMVAHEALQRNLKVINVSSFKNPDLAEMIPSNCRSDYTCSLTFTQDDYSSPDSIPTVEVLVEKVLSLGFDINCCIAGAETGVELCDRLSEQLILKDPKSKVKTNGSADTESRRNKYEMGEQVRHAGLRVMMQKKATTWSEIENYMNVWQPSPYNVIVKPMESAGSDGVTLCHSLEEVKSAFSNIMGKVNSLGMVNEGVLVQEYLSGIEYVVDTVSLNGQHTCCALWEYDRRPTNGAGFVLHGQKLLTIDEPRMQQIVDYHFKVLDSLNIKNSPGHGEVKWFNNEPVLVEVGSRCHGAEGMWMPISDEVYGYNQVQCLLDTFLDDEQATSTTYPTYPSTRKGYGAAKYLISYSDKDSFVRINEQCLAEIQDMSSYRASEFFLKPGNRMKKTIDCFTWAGCVLMANKDERELNRHYARIEEMCLSGEIYDCEEIKEVEGQEAKKEQCVAVVDPFSTGAVLASDLCKLGYKVICVYSASLKQMENLLTLVPEGVELVFDAIVGQKDGYFSAKRSAVYTAGEILRIADERNYEIVSVMPGAETGVCLSERVAELLELRSNGSNLTECRRNKFLMNERVRDYFGAMGEEIRVVKQKKVDSFDASTEEWLDSWNPSPFKVIVKPVESAGSDDVKLCLSREEVKNHCNHILGKDNQLGVMNDGVLIQEYLEGTEYVVDGASRDGVFKCITLWKYHKEAINGHSAPIVYFGQKTLVIEEEENGKELCAVIEYTKRVLQALSITQGPSHAEVKMVKGEPCLVEVGSRCHGAEACWRNVVVEAHGQGLDQVSAALTSILDEEAFSKLPDLPPKHKSFPRVVFIVSYQTGVLRQVNKKLYEEILAMQSFRGIQLLIKEGGRVLPTTDSFTFVGQCTLCHIDEKVVDRDYARIHEIENEGFLILE